MNVTLKSEQAELIQQQINSGKYQTPEVVIAQLKDKLKQARLSRKSVKT